MIKPIMIGSGMLMFAFPSVLLSHASSPIPSMPDLQQFQELWENSPFERTVLSAAPAPQADAQYVLIGVAGIGDEKLITLLDKTTNNHLMLSSNESPATSDRILELNFNTDPSQVSARAIIDGQTLTLRYDPQMLDNRPGMITSTSPVPANIPSAPRQIQGVNPAQVTQPGENPGSSRVIRRRIIRPPTTEQNNPNS